MNAPLIESTLPEIIEALNQPMFEETEHLPLGEDDLEF